MVRYGDVKESVLAAVAAAAGQSVPEPVKDGAAKGEDTTEGDGGKAEEEEAEEGKEREPTGGDDGDAEKDEVEEAEEGDVEEEGEGEEDGEGEEEGEEEEGE